MSMFKKVAAGLLAVVLAIGVVLVPLEAGMPAAVADEETPLFWDTSYSFEERAADLVSRLTLDEKVSQLGNSVPAISRLGIAKYGFWNEGLHGVANTKKGEGQYATSFPYSIAMAASWDLELVEDMMSAAGDEARAYTNAGIRDLSYWCPTINMSRDPRWGRNHEGFGEDNFLTSQLAISYINGYQGLNDEDNTKGYLKVISTLKHYAANNSEYNRENGSSSVQNQYIRDYFTRSFKDVIQGTDVNSVMSAYNMVNNVPSSGSYYLLDTLLRKTFGFDGYVVSDCGAIKIISAVTNHHWKPSDHNLPDANGLYAGTDGYEAIDYTKYEDAEGYVTKEGSVALCLDAGCDMDCGATYPQNAKAAVNAGILDEDVIDRSLTRIFTARMKTGEFDPAEEVVYRSDAYSWDNQIHSEDKITLAEDSSTQTIVMMKNDPAKGETDSILPLSKDEKNIVMVGALAQQNILGGYSGTPEDQYLSTPQQGVEKILGQEVTYISGKSGSNAYMCNVAEIILHKEDGSKVTLTPADVDAYTGCELDGTSNFRYIQPDAVITFNNVYMKDTNLVEIKVAGDNNSLLGHIEVHYGNVDGGMLADIDTIKTGSGTTYQSITGFNSNGSYDYRDIHVVFRTDESTVSFTDAEKQAIQNADAVIACIGGVNSAEGNDRANIALWNSQHELVKQVATLNPRTICHLQTVGVVEIESFKDITPAILWTCNNGQAQGNALARVLFGEVNPSAKLPFTWYSYNSQLETIDDYDLASEDYAYGGWTYQYFTGDVSYPFGHGLTYSNFEYSNLTVEGATAYQPGDVDGDGTVEAEDALKALQAATKKVSLTADEEMRADVDTAQGVQSNDALLILQAATKKIMLDAVSGGAFTPDDDVTVTVDVTNTSALAGKEIVQLYVSSPKADGVDRPFKQLKAFDKVEIAAGETKTVELTLPLSDVYFWDEDLQKNVWDQGEYTLFVGPSSDETDENALSDTFVLSGDPKDAISVVSATPSGTTLNAAKPGKKVTTDLAITMMDDTILTADSDKVTVTYESNRPSVATVDANGNVTPVAKGVATITVKVALADGIVVEDSYAVAVIEDLTIEDIQVNGETIVGFDPSVTEYYVPVDGTAMPTITYDAGGAQATMKAATSIPGDTTITLTQGDKTVTYTIHLLERSTDYVVASFSQMSGTYVTKNAGEQLYADWKKADQITNSGGTVQSLNFYEHNFNDLHLRATVTLSKPDDAITDEVAYGKGWIKLRSVENNGENNSGWDLDKIDLNLKTGVNYIDIPLSLAATTTKGTMDWTAVDRCIFVINTNELGAGYQMVLEDVRVVDTSLGGVRDELWAAIHAGFDTSSYTPESAEAYTTAYENALKVVLDEDATDAELRAAIQPLQDAQAHLEPLTYYKESFSEAARSFNSYNRSDSDVLGKNEGVGTNWKMTDNAFMDVKENRGNYYLQMTLQLTQQHKDTTYPVAPKDAWNSITVKLRSAKKANVSNDPNGADNTEHNVGWDFKPTMLNKADPFSNGSGVEFTSTDGGATVKISIPLDTPITNSRGIMDWSDIREIYVNVNFVDAVKKEEGATTEETNALRSSHSYTLTVLNPVVVDMSYVTEQKKNLNAVMTQLVDTTGADADAVTAYNTALANAQAVYATDFSTPYDVYDAQKALEKAINTVTGGDTTKVTTNFAALDDAIAAAKALIEDEYTDDSWSTFQTAVTAAEALKAKAGVTQREVNDQVETLQAAQAALEHDMTVEDPAWVRVNFTQIEGNYSVLVGGNTLWPDWTPGDGLVKDSQTGAGADVSGTAANGANKNLALYSTFKVNLADGSDSSSAWKTIKFRLRSSNINGERAAKHYAIDVTSDQIVWNEDGTCSVKIMLSDMVTENIDWTDLKELHVECIVADEYKMATTNGNPTSDQISLTMMSTYIGRA